MEASITPVKISNRIVVRKHRKSRGKPKKIWMKAIKKDINVVNLTIEMLLN